MEFVIYHNPRCTKSRQTLSLLESKGIQARVELYLENPLSEKSIKILLEKLDIHARDLVRKNEEEFKKSGLTLSSNEQALVSAMAKNPKIIERPIVVRGESAVIGRPPENVLKLIENED
tara:strand:- start:94 stop:450 length:357 start_codon:yes stop_codon:yes gene_type:complete